MTSSPYFNELILVFVFKLAIYLSYTLHIIFWKVFNYFFLIRRYSLFVSIVNVERCRKKPTCFRTLLWLVGELRWTEWIRLYPGPLTYCAVGSAFCSCPLSLVFELNRRVEHAWTSVGRRIPKFRGRHQHRQDQVSRLPGQLVSVILQHTDVAL